MHSLMALLCVASITRRAAIEHLSTAAASSVLLRPSLALAATQATPLAEVLEATANLPADQQLPIGYALRPEYGLETPDVFYPGTFAGRWTATSTLRSVRAPAGDALFSPGRNGTEGLRRARLEVGQPLVYEVRWRPGSEPESTVVDREYNVASISRAAMGDRAVQDVRGDGPDHLTLVLKPDGAAATSLFEADVRTVARRTDGASASRPRLFACAEVVRQTIKTVAGDKASAPARGPLTKEIETICTYEPSADDADVMYGFQRTATFLVPDTAYTGDPSIAELAASRLTRASNGRLVAVDIRVYDLVYRRVRS